MAAPTTIRRKPSSRRFSPKIYFHVVRSPDAEAAARSFRLESDALSFGRDVKGPTGISDPTMSRVHFGLRPKGQVGAYEIEDLGGTNGTFVGGARLRGKRPLEANHVIMAGETLFVVEREPAEGTLPAAPDADGEAAASFLGRSITAARIRSALETAATTSSPVLLLGPTGAGKEVAAQAIHVASKRKGPFVSVNCAAVPAELAESELFGHKKGAFTGAERDRPGHFLEAEGGTLFLDEIGELPAPLQAKLLRVLETGQVQPLGGQGTVPINVRIVAATNVEVDREGGDFRRDLLARVGDWVLRLPPLADRRADVLMLFDHFFPGGSKPERTVELDLALLLHDWPLNVRELKKLAGRLARLVPSGSRLDLPDLPPALQEPVLAQMEEEEPAEETAAKIEVPAKEELVEALRAARGNIKQLAEDRGWHRMQVYRWMQKYDLSGDQFR